MLIRKQLGLVVATLVLVVGSHANAQGPGPGGMGPGAIGGAAMGQDNFTHDSFGASFDPSAFDYDMAPFSPVDMSEYGGGPKAHSGFTFEYDRTYMSLTRPEAAGNATATFRRFVPTGNDWVSGSKFRVGYTGDSGNGWELGYQKSAGGFYSNGTGPEAVSPVFTDTELNRLQLNRVFRTDLSRGGYFEPYIGAGFLSVSDNFTQGSLNDILTDIGDPLDPADDVITTFATRFRQKASNSAAGGQIGARFSTQQGRWQWGSDFNVSALYNSQRASAGSTSRDTAATTLSNTTQTRGQENAFVPLVNIGMNASYNITRDLSLRLGGQLMHAWDGIQRVNTLPLGANPNQSFTQFPGGIAMTKENLTLAGFTFGLEWRR